MSPTLLLPLLLGAVPPGPELDLRLAAPITTWDEALPLGNGLLGGLLWGNGGALKLSLDRGDLWDERPREGIDRANFTYAAMQRFVAEGQNNELNRVFDHPYNGTYPTKLPGGRLELTLLDPDLQVKSFDLSLSQALGRARLSDGRSVEVFFSATQPVALLKLPAGAAFSLRAVPTGAVKQLGYPPARAGGEGTALWFEQPAALGLRYAVVCVQRGELVAVTITSTRDGDDPLALGRQRAQAALDEGWDKLLAAHSAWWTNFWSASSVSFPDRDLLAHYYLVQYFYGAASRLGAPPMPLQGVWTADGGLPPWKGDYHNDLNTQMTYIAYQTAGRFDEGRCFLDFLWHLLPTFRRFATEFYGTPGAAVPGVMSLEGQALGGWGHYSLSPTMSAWLVHLFYLHWRYTGDATFLKERALPWSREVGTCLRALLKPNADGHLVLPLSTSPEAFDNSARAWLKPNSVYDTACLKMMFVALAEMAEAAGEPAEAWRAAANGLPPFALNDEHELLLAAGQPLTFSHRHLSNLIGIYPFDLLSTDEPTDRPVIDASLAAWDKLGTGAWCGYSFSWMACLRARVGRPEEALKLYETYARAFCLRNGFHCNGDQTGTGLSGFRYRPFTLEGNFLGAQAVHEMLLQSQGGVLRVFPATAWRWHDASFTDLRAEGGHRVSARRERNATVWLRVVAGSDGLVRLLDNFDGRTPRWSRPAVHARAGCYEVTLKAGEVLEATLPTPAAVPPAPAGAAEPLVFLPRFLTATKLPLRIGADSLGGNRFSGDFGRVSVLSRALSDAEVAALAAPGADPAALDGCQVCLPCDSLAAGRLANRGKLATSVRLVDQGQVIDVTGGPVTKALHLAGGYLEIADSRALDCLGGATLETWFRLSAPCAGRLIDKSPAGALGSYLLDLHPGNALRMIVADHVTVKADLPVGTWCHVAGVIEPRTREVRLYLNGKRLN